MMSWLSAVSSFASSNSNAFCTCQGRGPVVNWGSLQPVRPRAETEHNFSLQRWITFPLGSPLPRSMFLSLSQLLHSLSLISFFSVLLTPSQSLSISISCSPPFASPFIYRLVFLALSFSRLPSFSMCINTARHNEPGELTAQWFRSWRLVLLSLLGAWKGLLTNKVMMRCIESMSKPSNPPQTRMCMCLCVFLVSCMVTHISCTEY